MIGSLLYAMMLCTRPDLSIQQLSRFNSNHTNAHFQAVKTSFLVPGYSDDGFYMLKQR
jgi:hypothetical protein